MKQIKKSLIAMLAFSMLFSVSACSNKDKKPDVKEEETIHQEQEEKVDIVANDSYVEPVSPTNAQKKAYNALSSAVENNDLKEEAKQVAINFVYDFFTLSNKKDRDDVGGLQFVPSSYIGKFKEFAKAYYYGNYPTIVNEYGKESLPEVSDVTVSTQEESAELLYNNQMTEGYVVTLDVVYKDTKLASDILKTNMVVTIIRISDYDYDSTLDYKKEYVQQGTLKEVYRVLAVE